MLVHQLLQVLVIERHAVGAPRILHTKETTSRIMRQRGQVKDAVLKTLVGSHTIQPAKHVLHTQHACRWRRSVSAPA